MWTFVKTKSREKDCLCYIEVNAILIAKMFPGLFPDFMDG